MLSTFFVRLFRKFATQTVELILDERKNSVFYGQILKIYTQHRNRLLDY